MHVYQINQNYIAAETLEKAYYEHLDDTNDLEELFDGITLEPGEQTTVEIVARRLTEKEIDTITVPCCEDGCSECDNRNEQLVYTLRELINKGGEFPRVIAWDM